MIRGARSGIVAFAVATCLLAANFVASARMTDGPLPLPVFDPDGVFSTLAHPSATAADRGAGVRTSAADISRDGRPDLLTVHGTSTDLTAHLGAGTGAFTTSVKVGTRPTTRTWIGQGDVDGDGDPDIASIDSGGSLSFALHTGTFAGQSTYSPETVFTTGWAAAQIPTFVDFFGRDDSQRWVLDGLADLIFRFSGDNSMYLYRNQGPVNGRPTFSNLGTLFGNTQAVTGLALADLTGDDFPDFYMTFTDGSARIFDMFAEMDSNGAYYGKWYVLQTSGADATERRLLLDATGDGWADLVIRLANGNLVVRPHPRDWDPAHPSRLFDSSKQITLGTGWGQYRLMA